MVAGAIVFGCLVRIPRAANALLFGDEFHSLRAAARGYGSVLTEFGAHGSGLALPLIQRLLVDLFGLNHWTIRMPAIAGGIATLALVYPLGRRMVGGTAAAVATALVAATSALVFYSHFGRSYALATALALMLLYVLHQVVAGATLSLRRGATCAVLSALLPYLHLTTLGLVGPVGAGAALALALQRRGRDLAGLCAALGCGVLAAFLLHLPAWESLQAFAGKRTRWDYFGTFDPMDVTALLFGSRPAAWGILIGLAIGLGALLWRRRSECLPLAFACIGPGLALAVARPYGDAYAYSRYALVSVPPACLVLGWLAAHVATRWVRDRRRREWVAVALGLAAAIGLYAGGPRGMRHTSDGPHANTYFGLYSLPAFDLPYDDAPEFYHRIARDPGVRRIIEAPALTNRARHLYRGYWLLHRKDTLLAPFPEELSIIPDGPYVRLGDPSWRERARADYLVLHLDPAAELDRYWRFVYGKRLDGADPSVKVLMERHSRLDLPFGRPSGWLREKLRSELGEPVFEDERIEVWSLSGRG